MRTLQAEGGSQGLKRLPHAARPKHPELQKTRQVGCTFRYLRQCAYTMHVYSGRAPGQKKSFFLSCFCVCQKIQEFNGQRRHISDPPNASQAVDVLQRKLKENPTETIIALTAGMLN